MITLDENKSKGIIWIASYPRSGNTWMRAFINALFRNLRDPAATDVDINNIEEGGGVENAAALYPRFLGKPAFLATPAEIAAARPWVQAALAESAGRPIYLKTHNANGLDHGSPLINKAASLGAVYVVRNPLDIAVSYARFSDGTLDKTIERMATSGWGIARSRVNGHDRVRVVMGSWSENVMSWTEPSHPAVLVVRYEDMVENPRRTFGTIARHLRTKPNRDQLARAIAATSFDRLRAQEVAAGFAEKPEATGDLFFREGRVGQWRESLSEDQVGRIVAGHRAMMKRFGYLPDGSPRA